ncbi:hypothetical protein BGZ54_008537 [Gamsiella multidivaricata]|nr:hypothetical protein BGZ54_008537 [Gamsiella multidivaricata]
MSSSPTHNVVRALQLAISVSIVATAAFLLHYRTQNHSNFTNEPLVSCITGAVAFIYAFWAILNHRRQPDSHKWIYLHGLGCLVVCALLIAGSTVAFIYIRQGVSCESLQGSQNTNTGEQLGASLNNDDIVSKVDYPPYQGGQEYAPGDMCENSYEDMDRACGVMGVLAAILWLMDFGLIFGFCGSAGRYGPHRNPRNPRRGQIEPDFGDNYDATPGTGGQFELQEDSYHDTSDRRKHELGWPEQRTSDDPRRHVQGPIPMSMQQGFLGDSVSRRTADTVVPVEAPGAHEEVELQTAPMRLYAPGGTTDEIPAGQQSQQQHEELHPLRNQGLLCPREFGVTALEEHTISPVSPSPHYIEFPAGPACYVFNSNQHKYLPSFVNMAARMDHKQKPQVGSEANSGSGAPTATESSAPSLPLTAAAAAAAPPGTNNSQRIVVTGLGFDVVSGDEDDSPTLDTASDQHTEDPTPPPRTTTGRPTRISLPPAHNPFVMSVSGPDYPAPTTFGTPATSSATGSHKSFMDNRNADGDQNDSNESLQSVQGQLSNKKASFTKRGTSKLSVISIQNGLQSNVGTPTGTANGELSSQALSSSRSPYMGDF